MYRVAGFIFITISKTYFEAALIFSFNPQVQSFSIFIYFNILNDRGSSYHKREIVYLFREAATKSFFLSGPATKPPPPSSAYWPKELLSLHKKKSFFLSGTPVKPPPLLVARPIRKELFLRLPKGRPKT